MGVGYSSLLILGNVIGQGPSWVDRFYLLVRDASTAQFEWIALLARRAGCERGASVQIVAPTGEPVEVLCAPIARRGLELEAEMGFACGLFARQGTTESLVVGILIGVRDGCGLKQSG